MNNIFFEFLRDPKTKNKLHIIHKENGVNLLTTNQNIEQYEIRNNIPRFVPPSNYTDNFGFQWNKFAMTQLDSFSGQPITFNRFWKATGWNPEEMKGKWVLDAGCGSGRFAEIVLKTGANVIALDYSNAVDACYENLKQNENLLVVQGDIYNLPFERSSFDYVYSLGVLQHTPDVKKSFDCLVEMLKVNGKYCVDFYEKSWYSFLLPKYILRPVTKNLPEEKLFNFLNQITPCLLNLSIAIKKIPLLGKILYRLIPVANYHGVLPLNEEQLKAWALLDTFDWLSPSFDNPQSEKTLKEWMQNSGLKNVKIIREGHLVCRGER